MVGNDLTIYSKFAGEWWKKDSPHFRSLQNLTPFRLSLINEMVGNLSGKKVLDLGCGGGLLSIPLIKIGAIVKGIDLSEESIKVASQMSNGLGEFVVGDICSLTEGTNSQDCIIIADVLDHIPNFARALSEASRVLKPGGKLFVGTINRNIISRFLTIIIGESFGYIPSGTHSYNLFIKPEELCRTASIYGLECLKIQGEWPLFVQSIIRGAITLRKSKSLSVAYSAVFVKSYDYPSGF